MSDSAQGTGVDALVPDHVIPHGALAPLRYRDMPEPVPLRSMIGPSVILAGLALGSGEFVIWPYITYKIGLVFFWACVLGVATQFFINMEVTRWALATGESAVTGFCRVSRHWAGIFLLLNIVPWMIPAWAVGAAELVSWLLWNPELDGSTIHTPYVTPLAVAGLLGCGLILTAGPVIYETVERIQLALVSLVMVLVVLLAVLLVRGDAVAAAAGAGGFGLPDSRELTPALLLGAIAFAGAGGTLNLGQANYVKDKGYGMGRYIGRITSPITGKEEPVAEIGYHFPSTPENLARWRRWWRAANLEHFVSFFLTCLVCLLLLSLISYSIFYLPDGARNPDVPDYGRNMRFIWGESLEIQRSLGPLFRITFLVMGVAILLTTEFGVLDASSRISTDIVKVNWLADSTRFNESRLYYLFLWGTILLGVGFLLVVGSERLDGLMLFRLASSLNGAVMFLYSGLLLYLNASKLPPAIRMRPWRMAIMVWSVLFFGVFTAWTGYYLVREILFTR